MDSFKQKNFTRLIMKEQNKPETVEAAALAFYNETEGYTVTRDWAFFKGAQWLSTKLYTAEDCEKMLESLRQSILDLEVLREVNTCRIESIDVHQFIPLPKSNSNE